MMIHDFVVEMYCAEGENFSSETSHESMVEALEKSEQCIHFSLRTQILLTFNNLSRINTGNNTDRK